MNDYRLTPQEAQHIIIHAVGVKYSTHGVRKLVYDGKILGRKKMGRMYISDSSLRNFIKQATAEILPKT